MARCDACSACVISSLRTCKVCRPRPSRRWPRRCSSTSSSRRDELRASSNKLLERKDRDIAWRDAKIEKITFELTRLKRWKFGAKSEAMTAEQRADVPGHAAGGRGRPRGATRRAAGGAAQDAGQAQGSRRAARAARRCPITCGASSTTTSPRTPTCPTAGLRPADDAHRRGHQRTAGHRAGGVLRAPAHLRQVGLPLLPAAGAGAGRSADHRRRHRRQRAGGAHADQPLRRPPAVLPAGDHQRPLRRAHAALDAGGTGPATPAQRWSRCSRRTSASC